MANTAPAVLLACLQVPHAPAISVERVPPVRWLRRFGKSHIVRQSRVEQHSRAMHFVSLTTLNTVLFISVTGNGAPKTQMDRGPDRFVLATNAHTVSRVNRPAGVAWDSTARQVLT